MTHKPTVVQILLKIILQSNDLFPVEESIEISAPGETTLAPDIYAAKRKFHPVGSGFTHIIQY